MTVRQEDYNMSSKVTAFSMLELISGVLAVLIGGISFLYCNSKQLLKEDKETKLKMN